MRVLFTTLPGAGPFHPLVPFARALARQGHVVAFATSRSYCAIVEAAGFQCFPAGYDWLVANSEPLYAHVKSMLVDRERPFSPLEDVYVDFLPPLMVADLLVLARSWAPDVIVRDPMEFAGCIAAEVLGVPHTACGPLFSFWDGGWHASPGEISKPNLCVLRRGYGLPPDPALTMLHRYLYLAFLPPAFPGPALVPPSTVHFLRPVSFNDSGANVSPPWLGNLPERPTVHASLGTVFHRTPGVFAAIIEGLRDEDINLIVAVGRDQDPAAFGPQPQNVRIERYIAHSLLLPYCDAVVTHGGFSSVMACLEEALPMVVVPLAGDQPGNAKRCADLGVAQVISSDKRTPAKICEAVREVLRNPSYRENALRLQKQMSCLPGPDYAVGLLEQLIRERTGMMTSSPSMQGH